MLIKESGRKKGGQLSTKLNLFDYKEFNLWLVLLSESSVRNHEVRLFCIHYYNIMYIMKCVNVCVHI